jgi:hypothetical protein
MPLSATKFMRFLNAAREKLSVTLKTTAGVQGDHVPVLSHWYGFGQIYASSQKAKCTGCNGGARVLHKWFLLKA